MKAERAIIVGIDRLKVLRSQEIAEGTIDSRVTLPAFANNRQVINAVTTSRLFSDKEVTIHEELQDMQKVLRNIGYSQLRAAFALDEDGQVVIVVFLARY